MYPEKEDAGEEQYYPPQTGLKSRMTYHLEGLVPLILIIIIGLFFAAYFGVITPNTPVIGVLAEFIKGQRPPIELLIIGQPSFGTREILNQNKDLVVYRVMSAEQLTRNARQRIANYDVVMLDQSNQSNKEVSRNLAEALKGYATKGGKLVIIMDSAIKKPDDASSIGWEAVFKSDLVPVSCSKLENNEPSCLRPFNVIGRIFASGDVSNHPIMKGVEEVPADPAEPPLSLQTFDVRVTGKELAYIEDVRTHKTFPAIVESRLFQGGSIAGKVIYFNYDPGARGTRGLFEATLEYLR